MIKNLTPHDVNIIADMGIGDAPVIIATYKSQGTARLDTHTMRIGQAQGVPLSKVTYGAAYGLPKAEPDVLLIVSSLVQAAYPDRWDLVVPSELVRDSSGQVIGCRSFKMTDNFPVDNL